MRPGRSTLIGVATFAAMVAAACGGGGGPTGYGGQNPPPGGQPPAGSTSAEIAVKNNRFDPAATTVNVGTTVRWTWDACSNDGYGGTQCASHSVTFDNGGPASPTQAEGEYTRQFSAAGTFTYRCTVHGNSMTGQVTVR